MKAILILAGAFSSCSATQIIWQDLFDKQNISLETYDIKDDEGKNLASKFNIKSFPALIVDEKVVAVGHPNEGAAKDIVESFI